MWRVVLAGRDSTMEYVYHVQAPRGATRTKVEFAAYNQHGALFARGAVTEWAVLVPIEVTFMG
jgi:hypothetical protein